MSNMFINTRAVSRKIVGDLKAFGGIYSILIQLVYIAFLVYSLCTGRGFFAVNITLIALSSLFFAFLTVTFVKRDFFSQEHKRSIKHAVRIISLSVKAVSLYITMYGIHVAVSEINTVSILFAVFMVFAWLCGALLEIMRFVVERYTSLMTSALSKDVEPFVKVYKRVTFKGYDGRKELDADTDVDKITDEYKKELSVKEASRKALREAEKLIEREKKRTAAKEKRAAAKEKRATAKEERATAKEEHAAAKEERATAKEKHSTVKSKLTSLFKKKKEDEQEKRDEETNAEN